MKVRTGIDERRRTFLDAGRIAEEEGCAAIALHARTAAQLYSGRADMDRHHRAQGERDHDPRARQRRYLDRLGRAGR